MRDHRRRTEIRLLVLDEEARRISEGIRTAQLQTARDLRDLAWYSVIYHVTRFLYFARLPKEFCDRNPAVPWDRLASLRYRCAAAGAALLMRPRRFAAILRFASVEVPEIRRHLSSPNYPRRWRNERAGSLGIESVLGPHRSKIVRLARRHGARRLRVYGSVARGEADARSDVDLIVEWKAGVGAGRGYSLQRRLEQLIGRRVDLHDASTIFWAIRPRVLSEAVDLW